MGKNLRLRHTMSGGRPKMGIVRPTSKVGGLVIAESTTYGNVHGRDKSLRFKTAFLYRVPHIGF